MKIRPIRGNLLVEPMSKETVTKGGIYIPETSDHNAKGLTQGRIIDMAEDVDKRRWNFKRGMKILFNRFSYTEIKVPPKEAGATETLVILINQDKVEACIDE